MTGQVRSTILKTKQKKHVLLNPPTTDCSFTDPLTHRHNNHLKGLPIGRYSFYRTQLVKLFRYTVFRIVGLLCFI